MKIESINFVNTSEVPQRARNTQAREDAAKILEQLAKVSAGKSLELKITGAKKWLRYALQRRLQAAAKSKTISVTQDIKNPNLFYVTKILILALTLAGLSWSVQAQQTKKPLMWIDPANQYGVYLQAAIQKKDTPVEFTVDKSKAQYIATLTNTSSKGTALRGFYGIGHPGMVTLSLSVSDISNGEVTYSYTCRVRAPYYQSAAECLAKHWKKYISKH